MSYFLRAENKNYELQIMALFHLKMKFTKHLEDRKSLLPVYLAKALSILNNFHCKWTLLANWHTFILICICQKSRVAKVSISVSQKFKHSL